MEGAEIAKAAQHEMELAGRLSNRVFRLRISRLLDAGGAWPKR